MAQKLICYVIFMMLLVMCLCQGVSSRPSADNESKAALKLIVDPSEYPGELSHETIMKLQQCEQNTETMELCMRCAKVTKSEIVYPMCCNNDDGAKDWCQKYVYYGEE